MAIGPSGWTRTTTSRVKNPACCVDTTKGELELIPGIEPGRRPYQGRRLPLHQISVGANGGTRTRTSRLGRPAGNRYPTFALVRPLVSIVDTEAEHGPVAFTGPGTPVSCQRPRSCELATAPGFEPGPTRFGGSDAPVTPRCRSSFTSRPFQRQNLPMT